MCVYRSRKLISNSCIDLNLWNRSRTSFFHKIGTQETSSGYIFMQAVIQDLVPEMATVEDMAAIFRRFGDEQSTLLDQYERLSFEVQLNKAMLGRSMSEPAAARRASPMKPAKQGRRAAGFQRVMRKLFGPILGKKAARKDAAAAAKTTKNPLFTKAFTRSLRV